MTNLHYSHGGKTEKPTEYILLDGCSLSTDDLVQLGNNMYKIKVIFKLLETTNKIETHSI